jgi:WD40 repeat protein
VACCGRLMFRPVAGGGVKASAEGMSTGAEWVKSAPRQGGGRNSLLACAVSSDARYLAVGGNDRKVHVYDARTRQHLQVGRGMDRDLHLSRRKMARCLGHHEAACDWITKPVGCTLGPIWHAERTFGPSLAATHRILISAMVKQRATGSHRGDLLRWRSRLGGMSSVARSGIVGNWSVCLSEGPRPIEWAQAFPGHRDAVSGLAFREGGHQLFSASFDRTLKQWSLDDMAYVETLYGHQGQVLAVDALRAERALSGGADHTARVWKIADESQLIFRRACLLFFRIVLFWGGGTRILTVCLWRGRVGGLLGCRSLYEHWLQPLAPGVLFASGSRDQHLTFRVGGATAGRTEWRWTAAAT